MTDKPMKNGRKYVDSGFAHDIMDNVNHKHYFLRAHVWLSMQNELPRNVVVVLSLIVGDKWCCYSRFLRPMSSVIFGTL